MEPRGKVALVTGGAARVGRAISLELAQAGAHLVVHYHRSTGAAQDTAAAARACGVGVLPVQADLADAAATEALAKAALDRFGGVDILVHAASPFVRASLAEVTLATWRPVMAVVVDSFLLLAQRLAPGMVQRGEGVLIPILDRGVFDPWPDYLAHGVAKSALWTLARSLAVELAPQVRVGGVLPGPVLPPPGFPTKRAALVAQGTLLGRWGSPQDVAEAVLFVVRSGYFTGEVLAVDGGERWAHRLRG